LSIVPGTTVGQPTTGFHNKGEIYVDSQAALFVCITDGNPGTWLRVATEPAWIFSLLREKVFDLVCIVVGFGKYQGQS
jgi:hypothetical protein